VAREGKVRSDRLSGSGIGKIKIKHSLSNDQIPLEHYGAYIGYAMDDAVEKSHKEAKKIGNEKNFDPNQIEKKFIKDYFSEEAALISGDIENISNEMKSINGDYIAINKALEEKKRFCFQEIGHLISLCSNFGNDLLANCSIKKGKMKGKYSGLKCKKIASTPADIHQVIIDPSLVENVSEADMISYTVHLNNGVNGNRPHQSKAAASSTANDT
jgi:hypothetical protein